MAKIDVDALAEEVTSAANIVTNGGYYEIDIDAVAQCLMRALAPLRRGMELRPPLTRERVGEAFAKAASLPFQRSEDYYGITIDRLHAALTEPQP